MTKRLVNTMLLRRLRKIRSALWDWSVGEIVKSLLDQLARLREIGLAVPLILAQPFAADEPAHQENYRDDTSFVIRVVVADKPGADTVCAARYGGERGLTARCRPNSFA